MRRILAKSPTTPPDRSKGTSSENQAARAVRCLVDQLGPGLIASTADDGPSDGGYVHRRMGDGADPVSSRRRAILASAISCCLPTKAFAADVPPLLSASARDTLDLWANAAGGIRTGADLLNKLQVSATIAFDSAGAPGLNIHAQIFRTDGESLSDRVGDIQTIDSIDTRPITRLFEAWVEKTIGGENPLLAIRAGLLDLNADFDSTQTASLFVNSSHGIGADLARSGRNGPSIYPVSALGAHLSWLGDKTWMVRLGVFDGVPGDPELPKAFVAAKLGHGALVIGQIDYRLSGKAKVEAGLWRYTTRLPELARPMSGYDQGGYASLEGPVPGADKLSAWLRLGVANGTVQAVQTYVGAGLVLEGPLADRPKDRLGLAIAHATISRQARSRSALPLAETSVEATYQIKVRETVAVQPDLQYVIDPAGATRARNAVVVGLRLVLTGSYPKKAPAADATDPTIPPEGP